MSLVVSDVAVTMDGYASGVGQTLEKRGATDLGSPPLPSQTSQVASVGKLISRVTPLMDSPNSMARSYRRSAPATTRRRCRVPAGARIDPGGRRTLLQLGYTARRMFV